MDWYYVENSVRMGPVTEAAFRDLVGQGVIKSGTLVWCSDMQNWEPYRAVQARFPLENPSEQATIIMTPGGSSASAEGATGSRVFCSGCGRLFESSFLIDLGNGRVCPECRDARFQSPQAGAGAEPRFVYGGFWIRFLARFLDGILLFIIGGLVGLVIGLVFVGMGMQKIVPLFSELIGSLIGLLYEVLLVGACGATLGKMACGLRVVRPNGERVTYLRSFGRYWAVGLCGFLCTFIVLIGCFIIGFSVFAKFMPEYDSVSPEESVSVAACLMGLFVMLIGLIPIWGYVMAAFDSEKRALHDRICDTRVIRK
jgi:uncharacterized RDD family membrane protein YckC